MRPLTAPAFNAQYAFRCTTAGTASTEPAWPANNNAAITTGGATFTNISGQSAYGWTGAAGNLYCLTGQGAGLTRFAIGDRAFLSSDHSETNSAANATYSLTAQGYGAVQIISVNRAGSVPPVAADALSGAAIVFTGSNPTIEVASNMYWQGVSFTIGGAVGSLFFANSATKAHYFRNCAFIFTTSVTNANLRNANPGGVTFDNTTVQFNNAGQYIGWTSGGFQTDFKWINTPTAILGTAPTILFSAGVSIGASTLCRGVDLSSVTGTLIAGGTAAFQKALFDSCRIASSAVRLGTTTYSDSTDEAELVNCYDGTNIISERHTPAGDVTTNRSTTLVGGAQDDVGLFSHQMVSSVRADGFAMTLDSFWMDVENTNIGSARTATVEIISSASLNNTDISLVLEYLGTAGSSLASLTSTLANALIASAALPTSTATWNSPPATPVAQHLQATFTPQQSGRVRGLVRLGKPSTTVWLNPQVIVT